MNLSFRWYGEQDPVRLADIRQIPGVRGIVTSLHHKAPGELWRRDEIAAVRDSVERAGLTLTVIESVPVHEDIKMGLATRDRYIEAYQDTLRNLAAEQIHTVCYNFMPLFDWLRTSLEHPLPDGSTTLAYDDAGVDEQALLSGALRLPAWNLDAEAEALIRRFRFYQALSAEALWEHLDYFVQAVMPVAKACGIKMAIHPDDPPWPVLGIPRIVVDQANLLRLLSLYDDPCHGLCFCSGSLGSRADNDLPGMVRELGRDGRIHFVHLRNVRRTGPHSFYESGHRSADGSIDMHAVMQALFEVGFTGPVRPDHGRMVWGETGNPGYGLFDRALGATYLGGLWEAISKSSPPGRA
ncbi:MAG: mannonate dehydratase [Firmicutes bacterium]|nr:mannonate dehydratase [Bacillota bacterium]